MFKERFSELGKWGRLFTILALAVVASRGCGTDDVSKETSSPPPIVLTPLCTDCPPITVPPGVGMSCEQD